MAARTALALLAVACVASAQSRFQECQVDLVEQDQPAGCVAEFLYTSAPSSGSVAVDCGKILSAARGSGARGARTYVDYKPALTNFTAVCSLLTLGQSCSNFLVASGFSLAQLNPCRSDYEYYVTGLIQQGKLNGTLVAAFAPSPSTTQAPYTGVALTISEAPNGLSLAPGPLPLAEVQQTVSPSSEIATGG